MSGEPSYISTSHDENAGAYYIKLSQKEIVKTISPIGDWVNIDLDKNGQVVGIEILIEE